MAEPSEGQLELSAPQESTGKDLAAVIGATPALMFQDAGMADAFIAKIKAEVAAFKPDLTTAKGRGEITALAYKVTRTKTAIDAAGKKLNEDARAQINLVDAQRRTYRDTLETLADEVRAPLTKWEAAEEARLAAARAILDKLREVVVLPLGTTAADARRLLMGVTTLETAGLAEFSVIAADLKRTAIASLEASYAALFKAEDDAAELKRLQEAEARRQADADAKAAADAEAERKRIADAAAEEQRQADLKAAEDRAAANARASAENEANRKLLAANAETERLRKSAEARDAEDKRLADEQAAREADQAHRKEVLDKAQAALLEITGVSKRAAERIVLAIAAGNVPGCKVEF